MSTAPFSSWYKIYTDSVGDLSKNTWMQGILLEIKKRGIKDGTILDLGGGNGVGSDLLQGIGEFEVTAFDKSQSMLDLNVTSNTKIIGDFMEVANLDKTYDLVLSGFDSLNYLNPKDMPTFFGYISNIINPGGLFLFDYSSPKFFSKDWRNAEFSQDVTGGRLDWNTKFDSNENRCDLKLSYWKEDKQEWMEVHSQYTATAYQINDALDGSTLSIEYVRNLDAENFSPQANTHVYVIQQSSQN